MDKNFHDLLTRYVNGRCTQEEIEKINRWYEEIADMDLQLEEAEIKNMESRIKENIRKILPATDRPSVRPRYLMTGTLLKAAAVVLILVVCGVWFFNESGAWRNTRLSGIPKLSDEMIFENKTGKSSVFEFPDGSTVRLEPSGRIHFSRNFSKGRREIYLTGKGLFDIVRDPSRPFYVYSGKVATRVLGTSFIVDAPAHASKVEVNVISGTVSVFRIAEDRSSKPGKDSAIKKNSTANGVVLSPNQKVEYFISAGHWVIGLVENPMPVKAIDTRVFSFIYANTPIKKVLADINERYDIEVVTENENIYDCTFTGDVSRMSLYDMLDVIGNSIGSTYEVKGTRILVSGSGCP